MTETQESENWKQQQTQFSGPDVESLCQAQNKGQNYRPGQLPPDLKYARFYKISDVGGDYVGFERDGVETYHRLSSIQTIIRGVAIDQG